MCIRESVSRTRFLPAVPGLIQLSSAVFRVHSLLLGSSGSARFFRCVGCGVLSVEMSVIQSVHVAVPARAHSTDHSSSTRLFHYKAV